MKYRRIPSGDHNDDLLAAAMAMGLIAAHIAFDYEHVDGEHRFWALDIPESCEPEKWVDV